VVVYTDHSPLQFLQRMSNSNQKLLRWNLELQEFNLIVKHRPGLVRGIGSPMLVQNRRQWARKGPGAR